MMLYDDRILSGSFDVEFAVELRLSGSTQRGWSGHGDFLIGGNVFEGIGSYGSVGQHTETVGMSANQTQYVLNSVNPDFLAAFQRNGGGKNCGVTEYTIYFDKQTRDVIQIEETFTGRIDEAIATLEGKGSALAIGAADSTIDYGKPILKKYTDAQQKGDHPDDRILEYLNAIQSLQLNWHSSVLTPNIVNNAAGLYKVS